MRRIGKWYVVFAFLLGIVMRLGELYQPLRLHSLTVENFTPALERRLRDWSEKFLAFHPLWLWYRQDLMELEQLYPIKIQVRWRPFRGTLEIQGWPLEPVVALHWQGIDYYLSDQGELWIQTLSAQASTLAVPPVPSLQVGDSFPVIGEALGFGAVHQSGVPASWFLALLQHLEAVPGVEVSEAELRRRGGEDVVACTLTLVGSGKQSRFLGRISDLPQNLVMAHQLLSGPLGGPHMVIDATYSDKIILRGGS